MENAPEPMTKTAAVTTAGGKKTSALFAFDLLVGEGYLAAHGERCGHPLYVSAKPYSESADLLARHHPNGEPIPTLRSV